MFKTILLITAVLLVISGSLTAAGLTIAENGKSSYNIVLAEGASLSERRAAIELKDYLYKISGATLPIVSKDDGHSILVGEDFLPADVDAKELGGEGFLIRTTGDDLIVSGSKLRGTLYGVYSLLEDTLGVRWYTQQVNKIPKMQTIRLPKMNKVEKPAFEYREVFIQCAFDKAWASRNRTNGSSAKLDKPTGGSVIYGKWCHTFQELVPIDKYWDTHPEYFSLVQGKRVKEYPQLCLTNPDVLELSKKTVLRWIEENPKATIFSVSANDWDHHCECDKCEAVYKEEGGAPSGLLLRFVNAIADEVGKKYPDKLIDTIAYTWTETPPKITKPAANVRVRLCPVWACQAHPYDNDKCEKNRSIVANLKAWSQVTDNLYIWHYNTDFIHYLIPFPDFEELASDVKLYHRNRVKGIFWQGAYTSPGAEFAELRAWMLAKLSWNPNLDANTLIDEFMAAYYGDAAKYVRQYFDLIHRRVRENNLHMIVWLHPDDQIFTKELLSEADGIFEKAEKAAAKNPETLKRVKKERLSVEYVQIMNPILKGEAKGHEKEYKDKLDALIAKCKEHGMTMMNEGEPLDGWCARIKAQVGG